jgi:hypothetical protein
MAVQNDVTLHGVENINIIQGDLFTKEFVILDGDGVAIDLSSGYTAAFTARETVDGTAIIALTQASGITLAAAGKLTLTIAASATAAYTFDKLGYSLKLTKTAGTETTEVAWGGVKLQPTYVHA